MSPGKGTQRMHYTQHVYIFRKDNVTMYKLRVCLHDFLGFVAAVTLTSASSFTLRA